MFTLSEAADHIRSRRVSPVELTRDCLSRIERLNPVVNAFITVTDKLALRQAAHAEAEIMAGSWRGPLHGVPIAIKDLFDTAGLRTTAASNQFRERIPAANSEMVQLLNAAGAILLGKLNLHEFAFGVSGVVSAFGPVKNPWNLERISGGSSSGSAVAVAGGLCVASIGTDTAGSIRCPAALCGIVGFRPSANLLGKGGAIPLASSFDTAGPMASTVADVALLSGTLAAARSSTANRSAECFDPRSSTNANLRCLKIGVPRAEFFGDISTDVASCVETALAVITELVGDVRDMSLQVSSDRTVFNAEIYEFHEAMATQRPELYDPRTLSRIRNCAGISASQYIRGLRALEGQRRAACKAIEGLDAVVTPAVLIGAPAISELQAMGTELRSFETRYLLRNTAPFSILYWPSISVPCGFTSDGLPVGLQISARPGDDLTVLRLAHAYEQATEWHQRTSPIATM